MPTTLTEATFFHATLDQACHPSWAGLSGEFSELSIRP